MLYVFLGAISFILLILANMYENILLGAITLITLWAIFFAWGVKKWKEYVLVCLFLIAFFLFLIGSYLDFLTGNYISSFNNEIELFIINMLYFSLVLIWCGCIWC